jgi:hypothetical protein
MALKVRNGVVNADWHMREGVKSFWTSQLSPVLPPRGQLPFWISTIVILTACAFERFMVFSLDSSTKHVRWRISQQALLSKTRQSHYYAASDEGNPDRPGKSYHLIKMPHEPAPEDRGPQLGTIARPRKAALPTISRHNSANNRSVTLKLPAWITRKASSGLVNIHP